MTLPIFIQGFGIGFAVAAPVGPIGILCLRRSLTEGPWAGFVTGLGAATADAGYGAVAAFGLRAVSAFFVGERVWLQGLGGAFLCFLGIAAWRRPPPEAGPRGVPVPVFVAYSETLLLTLANPATILSFVAVFAGAGLAAALPAGGRALLVGGVFTGSACWWAVLSLGAGWLRPRLQARWLVPLNRIAGAVLFAMGLGSLAASVAR